MLISFGYEIGLRLASESTVLFALRVHPSRRHDLLEKESFRIEPDLGVDEYVDSFGNHCGRVHCPPGVIRFKNRGVIRDSGDLDARPPGLPLAAVGQLPHDTLQFLLPSRYCEVDTELAQLAWSNFGGITGGANRVEAICDYVHSHLRFDYLQARANRTALEAWREKTGVCRDFAHLAITLCRSVNIPARYVTGYLGDIGIAPLPDPMDFSAWMEVFLDGRWYTYDPRHNRPRIGRIVIARGRDAADVALTTVFGNHTLEAFSVITEEISPTETPSPPAMTPEHPPKSTQSLAGSTR